MTCRTIKRFIEFFSLRPLLEGRVELLNLGLCIVEECLSLAHALITVAMATAVVTAMATAVVIAVAMLAISELLCVCVCVLMKLAAEICTVCLFFSHGGIPKCSRKVSTRCVRVCQSVHAKRSLSNGLWSLRMNDRKTTERHKLNGSNGLWSLALETQPW